jgi:hypothetical protein
MEAILEAVGDVEGSGTTSYESANTGSPLVSIIFCGFVNWTTRRSP